MFGILTPVLRSHGRTLVSQGVGLVGLAWCLAGAQAGFAVLLMVLVLTDQGMFLRGRSAAARAGGRAFPLLDGWCIAVSMTGVLICFAAVVRSAGLRDGTGGPEASGVLDSLAYVIACFAHGPTTLTPMAATGRLAGAVLAVLGPLTFLLGLAAVGFRLRRRA